MIHVVYRPELQVGGHAYSVPVVLYVKYLDVLGQPVLLSFFQW